MYLIKALLGQLTNRLFAICAAALGTALIAYFRSQSSDGIKWLLGPITRSLPWHHVVQTHPSRGQTQNLRSALTVVDLFLLTADGKSAIYAKTGNYVVDGGPLSSYYEGVTASENVSRFSTELGVIIRTTIEHGFHISHIDLGSVLDVGTRFRNVFRVQLEDCFIAEEEHWTQEIAIPTKHLILRVHFPSGRPPKLVRSKALVGLGQKRLGHGATITELFAQPAIVWEIDSPKLGDIYKLEWRW